MGLFLAEVYACEANPPELGGLVDGDRAIRYVRSIFLPEDETCFHLFEAPSAEALWLAARSLSLEPTRIVEAVVVVDVARRGRGNDRFSIELETGYDTGGTLRSGGVLVVSEN